MKFFTILFLLVNTANAQQFYTNISYRAGGNETYYLNSDSCDKLTDSTNLPIYTCPLGSVHAYNDIAVDAQYMWYISRSGELYKRKLADTTSCTYIGRFSYGQETFTPLVADTVGNIYTASYSKDSVFLYKYNQVSFKKIGNLPDWAIPCGDMFFYENRLFLTCYYQRTDSIFILEISTIPEQSCYYMSLGNMYTYSAFTIRPPEGDDKVFIVPSWHTGPEDTSMLVEIDMRAKKILDTVCTYVFMSRGAASYYPAYWDTTHCPVTTDISSSGISDRSISISNPAKSKVIFQTNVAADEIKYISLYDLSGRIVKSYQQSQFPDNIDISSLAEGMYIIRILLHDATIWNEKIIVR